MITALVSLALIILFLSFHVARLLKENSDLHQQINNLNDDYFDHEKHQLNELFKLCNGIGQKVMVAENYLIWLKNEQINRNKVVQKSKTKTVGIGHKPLNKNPKKKGAK